MNDWIEWKGGECPIPVGAVHERKYRDGMPWGPEPLASWEADPAIWDHRSEDPDADIIAYRIVEDQS